VIFDPVARNQAQKLNSELAFADDIYDSVKDADALVITTAWKQFKEVDLEKIKLSMKASNIIDGRNVFKVEEMKEKGFNYLSVGR